MDEAKSMTLSDLSTLVESINNQLRSAQIQGSERRQLESFRLSLVGEIEDLTRQTNGTHRWPQLS